MKFLRKVMISVTCRTVCLCPYSIAFGIGVQQTPVSLVGRSQPFIEMMVENIMIGDRQGKEMSKEGAESKKE